MGHQKTNSWNKKCAFSGHLLFCEFAANIDDIFIEINDFSVFFRGRGICGMQRFFNAFWGWKCRFGGNILMRIFCRGPKGWWFTVTPNWCWVSKIWRSCLYRAKLLSPAGTRTLASHHVGLHGTNSYSAAFSKNKGPISARHTPQTTRFFLMWVPFWGFGSNYRKKSIGYLVQCGWESHRPMENETLEQTECFDFRK